MNAINKTESKYLSVRFAMYQTHDEEVIAYEDVSSYLRACAWLRIACRYWLTGDSGWNVFHPDYDTKKLTELRNQPLTDEDKLLMARLQCHRAQAQAWKLLTDLDLLKVSVDYGAFGESGPALLINKLSVTPQIVTAIRANATKWQVQSIDIDDRIDEFLSLEDAITCAATRAIERHIREVNSPN